MPIILTWIDSIGFFSSTENKEERNLALRVFELESVRSLTISTEHSAGFGEGSLKFDSKRSFLSSKKLL